MWALAVEEPTEAGAGGQIQGASAGGGHSDRRGSALPPPRVAGGHAWYNVHLSQDCVGVSRVERGVRETPASLHAEAVEVPAGEVSRHPVLLSRSPVPASRVASSSPARGCAALNSQAAGLLASGCKGVTEDAVLGEELLVPPYPSTSQSPAAWLRGMSGGSGSEGLIVTVPWRDT